MPLCGRPITSARCSSAHSGLANMSPPSTSTTFLGVFRNCVTRVNPAAPAPTIQTSAFISAVSAASKSTIMLFLAKSARQCSSDRAYLAKKRLELQKRVLPENGLGKQFSIRFQMLDIGGRKQNSSMRVARERPANEQVG